MHSQVDKTTVKAAKIESMKKIRDAYLAAKKAGKVKKYRVHPV